MGILAKVYRQRLSLLNDLYQLTMAAGYWRRGLADREAVFQLSFRSAPFGGSFVVSAGLESVTDFLQEFRFEQEDLEYLATLRGSDGGRLFERRFLDYLRALRFTGSVDAMPEGTLSFAHEPLVRVQAPLIQCQLVETALLTLINFQSLIATKAARVCYAAAGDSVLEFGLRRAQGIDGGLSASRAAIIGGCAATSNVLAGKLYDVPVRGTHAHSWVMAFDDELTAFRAYAEAMPNNCLFLVDTYETLEGVRRAIQVGLELRQSGYELNGIRLDSGDLVEMSIAARRMLDEAGFPQAVIVASNDLDEYEIQRLKQSGAKINVWGVGTRLVTAFDQPALGGVYKLTALRSDQGDWVYKLKLSEQAAKSTNPGVQQVRRFNHGGRIRGDAIFDVHLGWPADGEIVNPFTGEGMALDGCGEGQDVLTPVIRSGELVYRPLAVMSIRDSAAGQLELLDRRYRELSAAPLYPVGMERELYQLKQELIADRDCLRSAGGHSTGRPTAGTDRRIE